MLGSRPLQVCIVLIGMLTSGVSAQSEAEPSAEVQAVYREVVTRAVSEFDAQRFAEARALFLRAHELWPSARTLRTLGMTSFELGKYPRALEELTAARDDPRRALPDDQRAKLLSLLERTHSFVGRYHIQLSPVDASLSVDGAPRAERELVLALGEHVLIVRAQAHVELRRALTVQGREDEALVLALKPLRVRKPDRTWAYLACATGGAGLIASGVFSALALHDKAALDGSTCPDQLCPAARASDVDEMKRFAHVATAGLVIGLVGVAVGSVLWFASRERVQLSSRGLSARF